MLPPEHLGISEELAVDLRRWTVHRNWAEGRALARRLAQETSAAAWTAFVTAPKAENADGAA